MKLTPNPLKFTVLLILIGLVSLLLASITLADEGQPPAPEVPTEVPTEAPTEVPTEPTPEAPTQAAPWGGVLPAAPQDEIVVPQQMQTSCQLQIEDLNDNNPFTYRFAAINASGIASYIWRINGADISTSDQFNHTFTGAGDYTIELTCVPTTGSNLVLSGSISIVEPPVANFSVAPGLTGFAPLAVTTSNTSTGSGLSYLWEVVGMPSGAGPFGTSNAQDTNYTFTIAGIYTIRLTVTDGNTLQSIFEQQVAVNERPPQANFSVTPAVQGPAPFTVTVEGTDLGGGPITSWSWNFGNGQTATGRGPHTVNFATENTYTIRMDYSGPGGSGMVQKQIVVFPQGGSLFAAFSWESSTTVGGNVQVCFANNSTGTIDTNTWDFGDGTVVVDNNPVVCHTYSGTGPYNITVKLRVQNTGAESNAERAYTIIGAPTAAFNASSTTITWGGTVNFDSSASTGSIDEWRWDFNNDGTIDSTEEHPSGIAIGNIGGVMRLGANTVRLTVVGPGGSAYSEMIINVERLALTCDFSGALSVLPGAAAQTYTSNVGSANGRTVSYRWTITGSGLNLSFNTQNITHTWATNGTYVVTLSASTPDGAACTRSKTVTVEYPPLNCTLAGPTAVTPGSTNGYTANVSGASGRALTYEWFLDGGSSPVQSGAGNTYSAMWAAVGAGSVRYVATAAGGATCEETVSVTIAWPTLQCSITGGSDTPRPGMPSDSGGVNNYTYTANVTGQAGRPLTYLWKVNGVDAGTGSTLTRGWTWNQEGVTELIELFVSADNGGGVSVPCATSPATRNISVSLPDLACNAPNGDATPVVGESVSFSRNLANAFNRPWAAGSSAASTTWNFEQRISTSPDVWQNIASGVTGNNYTYLFNQPGAVYRVQYSASVLNPDESCTSPWKTITTAGVGNAFTCDAWNGGNAAPSDPNGSYSYSVRMDNTNAIPLNFRWVLVGPNGETELGSNQSSTDGVVNSPAFSGAALGPIGDYVLRVDVSAVNPAQTSHTCSLQTNLNVGTFSVNYTYTGTATAIEVGQEICLTNTSTTSHNGIDGLSYVWDFGTTNTSFGAATSAAQQPGCFRYTAEGTYQLRLTGTNGYGNRTDSRVVTFNVYNAQQLLINRTDNHQFTGSTYGFAATATNINTYSWNIYNVATGNRVGTANRGGSSISQLINTPGQYRVHVRGTGPLGVTQAELHFNVISLSDIRAAFTPSVYAGVSSMRVCFTDNSYSGVQIRRWAWNFGNGQTLAYTNTQIPAEICTDYTDPGQSYNVQLTVENNNGATATATNIVRTYTQGESSSTFTITPVNAARYCFRAVLANGTVVTGWNFGDGSSAGAVNETCHTFQSTGTYLVTMQINGGSIIRTVNINTTPSTTPNYQISGACSAERTASFTITNGSTAMNQSDTAVIRDRNGVVVFSQPFQLGANGTRTFSAANLSGQVTFSTVDSSFSQAVACEFPPAIGVTGACQNGVVAFEISNTDGPMIAAQNYEVQDAGGTQVAQGSFQLARGAQPQIVTLANLNPYQTYTFTSSGASGAVNVNHTCGAAPTLEASSLCAYPLVFTLRNTGSAMVAPQTFTVTNSAGQNVTPANNTFQLAAGASTSITLTGLSPYGGYTLTSQGFAGSLNQTQACNRPVLTASGSCSQRAFTVTNTGSTMIAGQGYTLIDGSGQNHAPANSTLLLAANASITLPVPAVERVIFSTNTFGISATAEMLCPENSTSSTSAANTTSSTTSSAAPTNPLPTNAPVSGLNIDGLGIPDYANAPVCGHGCPTWRLYHTNETGDWEIFRLDGADEATRQSTRRNLSLGVGENISDMAPSPSPNNEWIVFTSNRDSVPGQPTNWELYVAPTSGGSPEAVQRVTFNTTAIDTDPVWGPNNYVVFETTRHGNWDLYAVDMSTGREYRLTDHEADDINPFWSPDGSKLVFQSARDGFWQIYELTLATMTLRRLSDGSSIDVEPQYSFGGDRIAFRTYAAPEAPSVIGLMNADGSARRMITTPEEDATNHVWSPNDALIAYQSDKDGDLDVYVYAVSIHQTRQLTDNVIPDYAPTWLCDGQRVVFTSDVMGNPDIYEADSLPIIAPPIRVEDDADQMTFEVFNDIYPQTNPPEENASREGQTAVGVFGEQTVFLQPEVIRATIDLSLDGITRQDSPDINVCPAPTSVSR